MPSLRRNDRVRVAETGSPVREGTVTAVHRDEWIGHWWAMVRLDGENFDRQFADCELEKIAVSKAKRETGAARRRGERHRG